MRIKTSDCYLIPVKATKPIDTPMTIVLITDKEVTKKADSFTYKLKEKAFLD